MSGFEHKILVNGQVVECDTRSLSWVGCMLKEPISGNGNSPIVKSGYPRGTRGMKSAGCSQSEIDKFEQWVVDKFRDGLSAKNVCAAAFKEKQVQMSNSTVYRLDKEYS